MSTKKLLKINFALLLITFILFVGTAIALKPNYNPGTNFLSDLGLSSASALFFNSGIIISGILLFSFFYFLSKNKFDLITQKIGLLFGFLASIFLILVGLFPENTAPIHFIVSASFFLLAFATVVLFSIQGKQNKLTKNLFYNAISILFIISSLILILTRAPLPEHSTVILFGCWLAVMTWLAGKK